MRKRETPRTLIYKGFQAFLALVSVKLGIMILEISNGAKKNFSSLVKFPSSTRKGRLTTEIFP